MLFSYLRGLFGWRIKKIAECAFFWDYYILGWDEPSPIA